MTAAACGYYRTAPKAVDPGQLAAQPATQVSTPAKAHLKDGGVVLFPGGFAAAAGVLKGTGEEYDLTRQSRTLVQEVPLSDMAALEHYEKELLAACTVSVTGPKQLLIPEGELVAVALASGGAAVEGEPLAVIDKELVVKEQGRLVAIGLPAVQGALVKRYALNADADLSENCASTRATPRA